VNLPVDPARYGATLLWYPAAALQILARGLRAATPVCC
jgi:hypothetical protein